MNTAQQVDILLAGWKEEGLKKADILWRLAEACVGWSYVWGGYGQNCTPSNRRSYADRSSCPEAEAAVIRSKCQVLSNKKADCTGCQWYPGGCTLFFDCRGFTRWCLGKLGIELLGAGATSQWNTESNWAEKGLIADLPKGQIACFFHQNGKTMEHTGFVLDGVSIHCSGTVKKENISKRATHYAIPKGLEGELPVDRPTLRKGSKGEYVTLLQARLIQLGYDLAPYGADGSFGNKTLEAVKKFQSDHGLVSDGVVGQKTWAALDSGTLELFTVTVPHLSAKQADALIAQYPGASKKEEPKA